ncbi:MAG: sigma-54-dependent Fis family transcriptional regulator [Bacteroidales bacterium]|nr:MAG: sigma-54-dependent Fis family transcriptional regulator [Bacteroidales bacterium]
MKQSGKILVVDDNEEILLSLELLLSKYFETIRTLKTPANLPSILGRERFDVYILDMNFSAEVQSGNEGFYWMQRILTLDKDAVIIFITAFAGIEIAVRAIKEGATDFIEKPWDNRKLVITVQNAFKLRQSRNMVTLMKNRQKEVNRRNDRFSDFYRFDSAIMKRVYDVVNKVAGTDTNVLILGENGTGKEIIAREIHYLSGRREEMFVHVDIGSLPESLFENELFGHIRGAFTDAREDRPGRFEIASGGTLFLDEIGNIPVALQSKILYTLQNNEVIRLGSNDPITINTRLICATNQPLFDMVESGTFREDLLYRINTVQIDIPPLRSRRSDISPLAQFFLEKYGKKYHRSGLEISRDGIRKLVQYDWPGNIRQLQHVIENAVVLSTDNIIRSSDFIFRRAAKEEKVQRYSHNYYANEKNLLISVLDNTAWNLSKAAEELGIARSTLYRKIKKHDL